MILGRMIDVVVWDMVTVLDIQGHNLSSYQVAYPFVNPYLNQDFSGILQHETDVLTYYIRDKVISE
jgi:hypothetical protein